MSVSRSTLKRIAVGCASLPVLGMLSAICFLLWESERTLYRWSNSESEIRIYTESRFERVTDAVYFKVAHRNKTIARRYLCNYSPDPLHFEQVATADGRLVCVYEREQLRAESFLGLFIVDFEAGECWPLSTYTEPTPEVLARWKKRYEVLRKEHPSLPEVTDFDPPKVP